MAIHGRLYTGDKLSRFGYTHTGNYGFCHNHYEDHNYFFCHYPFSDNVWKELQSRITVSWPCLEWPELVNHISKLVKGNSVGAIISRLGLTCTVYQLWLARNNKIFNNDAYPEAVVVKRIVDMIRFRMLSITNLKNHSNDSWFLNKWRLPTSILKERCSDGSRRTLSDVRSDNVG